MPKSQSAKIKKAKTPVNSPAKHVLPKTSKSPSKQQPKKQSPVVSPIKSKKGTKSPSISPTPASPAKKTAQAKTKARSKAKAIEELMEQTLEEAKEKEKAPVFPQDAVCEPDAERPKLMPKKPLSPFFQFSQAVRPLVVKEYPAMKLTQVAVLIGQKWHGLDEKDKATYKNMQLQDQIRFEKETKMLNEKGFFITKEGLRSCDLQVKFKPTKTTLMPKKPLSAWIFYSIAHRADFKDVEKDNKKVMKMISEKWASCGSKEKKKFEMESQKDHKRHQAQLAELDEKGYFLMEDGSKSSEYEVIPKDKKRSSPTETTATINSPSKRQKK